MGAVIESVDEELLAVLGKYWTHLKAQSKGMIAVHTILVLWRATKLPSFDKLTDKEKNALKWACLLHDISKRGAPTVLGRDHCHAF